MADDDRYRKKEITNTMYFSERNDALIVRSEFLDNFDCVSTSIDDIRNENPDPDDTVVFFFKLVIVRTETNNEYLDRITAGNRWFDRWEPNGR